MERNEELVKVVRCKDCIHSKKIASETYCRENSIITEPEGFCYKGEEYEL